ncbi:MAG: Aminolevulinate dehydratase [Chaenotheca gracillima]|nr:MAG: Aminolevulinate dehydratase [Chaenotheca gracillima]
MTASEVFRPAFPPKSTPYLSYNLPYPAACAKHVADTFHASRVYIIASGTLSRTTDSVQRLQDALGADKVVGVRRGMQSHTLWSEVLQVVREAKATKADCLVTLGAGSLTDGAKIIALALANDAVDPQSLETLVVDSPKKRDPILPATVPIICIPTSLSGGEYSTLAGGTNDATSHKHPFVDPSIGPKLIILDPALSTTTPPRWWLSTGIRAVDHCVETLCSSKPSATSDVDAERSLRSLVPGLLHCAQDPHDLPPRLACQMGVVDAMKAVSERVPLGASHGIGHQLGPLGVGHGETSCILLPAVMKYNKSVNAAQQTKVLNILWSEDAVREILLRRGLVADQADLGDVLDAVIAELGMPRSLAAVGVGREKLDALAEGSLVDRWVKTNPIPLTRKEQVLEILEMVVGDEEDKAAL